MERQRLGVLGRVLLAFLGVGVLGLAGGTAFAFHERRQELVQTRRSLEASARQLQEWYGSGGPPSTCGRLVVEGHHDAWGTWIGYRSPGKKHDWEFVSFGPDRVDDAGEGDDLVVGGKRFPFSCWR